MTDQVFLTDWNFAKAGNGIDTAVIDTTAIAAHFGNATASQKLTQGLNTMKRNSSGGSTPSVTSAKGGSLGLPSCSHTRHEIGREWELTKGTVQVCLRAATVKQGFSVLV